MSEKPLTRSQAEEQLLLDFGLGWVIRKLELHNAYCPEGILEKYVINHFLAELPRIRRELCWIRHETDFEMQVDRFRRTINASVRLLERSKSVIVAYRQTENLEPVWPEDLEWDN